MRDETSEVDMLRGNMAPRRPAKLHLSDQDRCGVGGAGLEVSPTALLDPSEDFLFPKAIATNSSREVAEEVGYPFKREWSVVGTEPTLLVRVNHEPLSTSELGPAGRAAFNRCEAEVPPPVSMFRKAIRSGSGEDDRRKLGVVGCSNDGFFADNCPPAAPNDSALSNATTPRAARLNDCEFRDRAPRALLLTFSRDIIAPTEDSRRASAIRKFQNMSVGEFPVVVSIALAFIDLALSVAKRNQAPKFCALSQQLGFLSPTLVLFRPNQNLIYGQGTNSSRNEP